MIVIEDSLYNIHVNEKLCIALGTFDGVHNGHRIIIKEAIDAARSRNAKSAVLTFDRHPLTVLRPEYDIKLITENKMKAEIIESLGIDYLIFAKFDATFAQVEAKDFLFVLKKALDPDMLICGYNYTFGKNGSGDTRMLNQYKELIGYDLRIVERVKHNNHRVSSSSIRKKMLDGEIAEANNLLGYNFFYLGLVSKGKGLGNKMGFPTANIPIADNLALRNGVYITRTIIGGNIYPSISNVGYNPTFNEKHRCIETFLLNFDGNLYDKEIRIEFIDFIRDEMKFESIDCLKDRVFKDIQTARQYFLDK